MRSGFPRFGISTHTFAIYDCREEVENTVMRMFLFPFTGNTSSSLTIVCNPSVELDCLGENALLNVGS